MSIKQLFLLIVPLTLLNCAPKSTTLYVGTYTNGESEGIYKFHFNTKTGALSNKQLAATTNNPSYIAFSPNKKYLYAVGEGETNAITAFKINTNGSLEFINSQSSNGKSPCHVNVNEAGNKVVVSNYTGGSISLYNVNDNGSLNKASQIFNHNNNDDKKPARAHSAQFHNNNLFVADLGKNAIYQYVLNDSLYKLKSSSIVKTEGNPGPRHFAVTKNNKYLYVINEYGNSITSIKKTDSGFTQIDYDSTLNKNNTQESYCADIHLSKDERFLYGSNRGENTIAVFKRNTINGTIEKIQTISVYGNWPRNFTLDPSGEFLLVANQKSNNISVFSVNKKSGKLQFLHRIETPSPVCLKF